MRPVSSRAPNSPPRVGFLIDRWNPMRGGTERALATFAAWLEARGCEVLAFGLEGPPAGVEAPGTFVPVTTHGWTRGTRERHLARNLVAAARAMGCNVTIGVRHLEEVDLYWPHGGSHRATLRALGKRKTGRHRAFLDLERRAVADGGARRVVCVSELVRRELLDDYPTSAQRLRLVPNGLDLERFRVEARDEARAALLAETGWSGVEPILTFVGRNAKLKGLPRLVEALRRVDAPWRLFVAGPKDAGRWRSFANKRLGGADRVHVVAEFESLHLAAGSDLLVLPSRRDSCGLVVLEALATGTPVLISDAVGAKEALRNREDGEVFPVRLRPAELARRIEERLKHIESNATPHAEIAGSVRDRGLEPWLLAMERELLDLARPSPQPTSA